MIMHVIVGITGHPLWLTVFDCTVRKSAQCQ